MEFLHRLVSAVLINCKRPIVSLLAFVGVTQCDVVIAQINYRTDAV